MISPPAIIPAFPPSALLQYLKNTPGDKKRNNNNKETFKGRKPFYATYIHISINSYTSNG
jgi:hypothetical protein